jgi:hypothetical protein
MGYARLRPGALDRFARDLPLYSCVRLGFSPHLRQKGAVLKPFSLQKGDFCPSLGSIS